MIKDILIGIVSGILAVVAMAMFSMNKSPVLILREVTVGTAWPRSQSPGLMIATTRPDPARAKLEKVIDKLQVKDQRLDDVLVFLADLTGANIAVHWRALQAAGINPDMLITLDLRNLPARVVLQEVLSDAGGTNTKLAYRFVDGIVRISTEYEFSTDVVTKVYDVEDLLPKDVDAVRPEQSQQTAQDPADSLVQLIETNVSPASWRDAGGSTGSIREFMDKLVVTQTIEAHQQIAELLAELRRKPSDGDRR